MNFSSTTRPLPPIPVNGTGTIASSSAPHPAFKADVKKPPRPASTEASGQGGSIFFAILRFFGL